MSRVNKALKKLYEFRCCSIRLRATRWDLDKKQVIYEEIECKEDISLLHSTCTPHVQTLSKSHSVIKGQMV